MRMLDVKVYSPLFPSKYQWLRFEAYMYHGTDHRPKQIIIIYHPGLGYIQLTNSNSNRQKIRNIIRNKKTKSIFFFLQKVCVYFLKHPRYPWNYTTLYTTVHDCTRRHTPVHSRTQLQFVETPSAPHAPISGDAS